SPAGAARVGNAGVGILEGPGTIAVNAGLSKTMTLREGLRLRFEATFTNVLNHTNFAPPATNVSNPSTLRGAAIRTDRGERREPHRTSSTATRLLIPLTARMGSPRHFVAVPNQLPISRLNNEYRKPRRRWLGATISVELE